MKVEGVIDEIIFRNEQNGYTVMIVDQNNTPVTAVGKMVSANIGENISLEGEFTNSKYGFQFSFSSYEVVMPTSLKGIERYLCSGLIKGVGPVTAKTLLLTLVKTLLILLKCPLLPLPK